MSGRELRENPYLTPLIANIANIANIPEALSASGRGWATPERDEPPSIFNVGNVGNLGNVGNVYRFPKAYNAAEVRTYMRPSANAGVA